MKIVNSNEMQIMDKETIESYGISSKVLMENAGRGVVQVILDIFYDISSKKVGIAAGSGNNGGDGFVVARYLFERGINVKVYLVSESSKIKGDALYNLNLLKTINAPVIEINSQYLLSENKTSMLDCDIWIDAIFGTGLNSEITGYYKDAIELINESKKPVISVDIPSGLNADNGKPCGISIKAHTTVTFAFPKIGHILYPGLDYTGDLKVIDIGIPSFILEKANICHNLLTEKYVSQIFKPRHYEAHKGTTGHLLLLASSRGKTGAGLMAALAAMRTGAGLVTLSVPESLAESIDSQIFEIMVQALPEKEKGILDEACFETIMALCKDKKCLALGPGIGVSKSTQKLVHNIVTKCPIPMVIDADGLNCISEKIEVLKNIKNHVVLTPHPGEMARLCNLKVKDVQNDRIGCAGHLAKKYNVYIVLKGARTVIAHPDGQIYINPTGNPGMASGGAGDVLTGIIAGFITQGYDIKESIHAGVYLHGFIANNLAINMRYGYIASDIINNIPHEMKKLSSSKFNIIKGFITNPYETGDETV